MSTQPEKCERAGLPTKVKPSLCKRKAIYSLEVQHIYYIHRNPETTSNLIFKSAFLTKLTDPLLPLVNSLLDNEAAHQAKESIVSCVMQERGQVSL